MKIIKEAEEKEARTIKPGYSWRSYTSIESKTDKLDLLEQTDRRLFFELTGHKIDTDGQYEEVEDQRGNHRYLITRDPSSELDYLLNASKEWTVN